MSETQISSPRSLSEETSKKERSPSFFEIKHMLQKNFVKKKNSLQLETEETNFNEELVDSNVQNTKNQEVMNMLTYLKSWLSNEEEIFDTKGSPWRPSTK